MGREGAFPHERWGRVCDYFMQIFRLNRKIGGVPKPFLEKVGLEEASFMRFQPRRFQEQETARLHGTALGFRRLLSVGLV